MLETTCIYNVMRLFTISTIAKQTLLPNKTLNNLYFFKSMNSIFNNKEKVLFLKTKFVFIII